MHRIFHSICCVFFLISCTQRPLPSQRFEVFQKEGLYGYRHAECGVVIAPRYYVADDFNAHGIAAVADDSGWAYIDQKGEIVVRPFVFDNGPDYFQEHVARFTVREKFGLQFDCAHPFVQGRARVQKGKEWFMVDRHGVLGAESP